ncbi:hypothetical protein SESBI_44086 [Sesbania bispinosa]|nr:hypothetical protein SESBI_44086 [Sesbania bispinosa]
MFRNICEAYLLSDFCKDLTGIQQIQDEREVMPPNSEAAAAASAATEPLTMIDRFSALKLAVDIGEYCWIEDLKGLLTFALLKTFAVSHLTSLLGYIFVRRPTAATTADCHGESGVNDDYEMDLVRAAKIWHAWPDSVASVAEARRSRGEPSRRRWPEGTLTVTGARTDILILLPSLTEA